MYQNKTKAHLTINLYIVSRSFAVKVKSPDVIFEWIEVSVTVFCIAKSILVSQKERRFEIYFPIACDNMKVKTFVVISYATVIIALLCFRILRLYY